ncbi:MAG TPA: glycosyltransferase family 1 protein [Armatimonadetes bacterium]|nr:glycosyltransferase family 1 protein [Armatimonadota bacterium]
MWRVVEILEATTGGTRKHLLDLVFHLDRSRFEVEVIVSPRRYRGFAADMQRMQAAGIPVHVVPMQREIALWDDLRAFWRIWDLLRRGGYDIVHTHSAKAGILGRFAAWLTGVPVILYTPHAFPFFMQVGRRRRWLYLALEWLAAKITTRLIAVSEGERQAALARHICEPERIVTIENGLSPTAFNPAAEGTALRQRLGLREEHFVIGTVGQLVRQKGDRYLIEAAPRILHALPQARFLLVGTGPKESLLRELAQRWGVAEAVIFAGHQEEVEPFYAAFDLFVLPSLWEGCPYALLEAMQMAKPVVATRIAGSADIVVDDNTGWLVPPGDSAALARAIIALAQDPQRRHRMGERGRQRVLTHFTLERMIRRTEDLYETLARPIESATPSSLLRHRGTREK